VSAIEDFCRDIGDVPVVTDERVLRLRSRDQFAISPLLRSALAGKSADVLVSPRSKDEIRRVVAAAARHRLPLTARGGGTANYGQSVPLEGGILLDMTSYKGVLGIKDGIARVCSGTVVDDVDVALRAQGFELRIHPSTTTHATIGGFVAGGSGGIGSAQWGMLRDRGNIVALEVMSCEEEPRLTELRGDDVALVHHAYGTNAIITEMEVPVAPAWAWRECLIAFPDYISCARFGIALAHETGIVKKLISIQEWPVPQWMRALNNVVPDGHSMANCYIAPQSRDACKDFVVEHGGTIVADHASGENPFGAPLFEFAYGHGLRQLQKADLKFTGLQGLFPAAGLLDTIAAVHARVDRSMPMRLEIFYSQGEVVGMGSPLLTFESDTEMARMVELLQSHGVHVANSHTTGVREVGIKQITDRDITFKQVMDPHGLLNPGKMDFGTEIERNLPTSGWVFRRAG
jgi:hypothetical protein